MATHSSVLAWRIPGTGEPGGLPSVGSHRVGHDWSNLALTLACDTSAIRPPSKIGRMTLKTWNNSLPDHNSLKNNWCTFFFFFSFVTESHLFSRTSAEVQTSYQIPISSICIIKFILVNKYYIHCKHKIKYYCYLLLLLVKNINLDNHHIKVFILIYGKTNTIL